MTGVPGVAPRSQFDPLGAGATLLSVLAVSLGLGALIGLAAGSLPYGVAVGALVGVPASIVAVIVRYRDSV
jgi:F0F1-type ATP synthase assembly protein I